METNIQHLDFYCRNLIILTDVSLEYLIDYCALYSKKHWLILIEERLKRIEEKE